MYSRERWKNEWMVSSVRRSKCRIGFALLDGFSGALRRTTSIQPPAQKRRRFHLCINRRRSMKLYRETRYLRWVLVIPFVCPRISHVWVPGSRAHFSRILARHYILPLSKRVSLRECFHLSSAPLEVASDVQKKWQRDSGRGVRGEIKIKWQNGMKRMRGCCRFIKKIANFSSPSFIIFIGWNKQKSSQRNRVELLSQHLGKLKWGIKNVDLQKLCLILQKKAASKNTICMSKWGRSMTQRWQSVHTRWRIFSDILINSQNLTLTLV